MKLSKRKMTIISFSVGACLFVSTAFADALLGSGYDRFKDSIKTTAEQMEQGLDNYTVEMLFTVKDNGRTIEEASTKKKMDTVERIAESVDVTQYANGDRREHYSYTDRERRIWKSGSEDKYRLTEFTDDPNRREYHMFSNPFNEQGAQEMEKIVDALVGNLKEHVQAEERPEGGKVYAGSLSATQVPALVNAVTSFGVKQMIRDQHRRGDENEKIAEIESDIHVKSVKGTAIENNEGILEQLTGEFILSGEDKSGAQREISLNVVFNLTDIGNTQIQMPDLTGADVEKVSEHGGISEKHIGTYKNNIVIDKDGQIVKIGERTLEITAVDNGNVSGTFTETVQPGYEADYPDPYQFSFDYKHTGHMPVFTYTNPNGEQESGQIHMSGNGRLHLDLGMVEIDGNSYRIEHRPHYDQQFHRIFEEE